MAEDPNKQEDPEGPAALKRTAGTARSRRSRKGATREPHEELREEDFTKDPQGGERAAGLSKPQEVDYNPAKDREWARGAIALTLVGVLAGMVVLAFIYVLISLFILKSFRDIDSLKTLLEILFSPVVGLVGAVTGFYFGEKTKS